ncbi:pentapeptide repeat-containing protein [Gloeomargarita sp.]
MPIIYQGYVYPCCQKHRNYNYLFLTAGERDFSGICLIGCNLQGANLAGINLSGADLLPSVRNR